MTDYYKKNREKILAYQKEYRELHKKPTKIDVIEIVSSNNDELTNLPKNVKSKLQNKKKRLERLLMRNEKKLIAYKNNNDLPIDNIKAIEIIYLETPINPFLSV